MECAIKYALRSLMRSAINRRRHAGVVLRRRQRQVERERGAAAAAGDADMPAQQRSDDVVADRQSQAAAGLSQLGGEEGIEYARQVFGRDAVAVVAEGIST